MRDPMVRRIMEMTDLHKYDEKTWIETVWEGLHLIHPQAVTEEQHDDLMTAMAWITEHMGYEWDTTPNSPTNGELIQCSTE
jgi:hypothetical protein